MEEGAIDLETLDDSGENAMPLLSAVSSDLISTLRSKSVTGIFMVLNTEDLDQIGADVTLPGVYIRDLDPSTTPSERNADLLLERSPIQLVKQMDVSTDKGSSSVPFRRKRWKRKASSIRFSRRLIRIKASSMRRSTADGLESLLS